MSLLCVTEPVMLFYGDIFLSRRG